MHLSVTTLLGLHRLPRPQQLYQMPTTGAPALKWHESSYTGCTSEWRLDLLPNQSPASYFRRLVKDQSSCHECLGRGAEKPISITLPEAATGRCLRERARQHLKKRTTAI